MTCYLNNFLTFGFIRDRKEKIYFDELKVKLQILSKLLAKIIFRQQIALKSLNTELRLPHCNVLHAAVKHVMQKNATIFRHVSAAIHHHDFRSTIKLDWLCCSLFSPTQLPIINLCLS